VSRRADCRALPIEQVREAVSLQAGRHARGKVVITL